MALTLKASSSIAWSAEAPSGIDLHQVCFGPDPSALLPTYLLPHQTHSFSPHHRGVSVFCRFFELS